jgi:hypothetical protein
MLNVPQCDKLVIGNCNIWSVMNYLVYFKLNQYK